MDELLKSRCDLFIKNRNKAKDYFTFEYNTACCMSALLYSGKGKELNGDKIKECKKIIKDKTSMLSNFRGNIFFQTASILSLSDNAEGLMDDINLVYNTLKNKGFKGSEFLGLASIMLALRKEDYDIDRIAGKSLKVFKSIKNKHKFLTSTDDYGFTIMLAMNDKPVEEIVEETERCYLKLKTKFNSCNALQSLSHVLAMDDRDSEYKCNRTFEIYEKLLDKGLKFTNGYEFVTLGLLSVVDCNVDKLVEDVSNVYDYLKGNKGFGAMSLGKQQRLMYASIVSVYEYIDEKINSAADIIVSSSVMNVILMTQMAAISASAAAAAAAASN